MKILLINGSPKRDKSDALKMTRAFLDGMNEYEKQEIVLLDMIRLEEEFMDSSYEELCEFADKFNFKVKERHRQFNDWDELHEFLEWFSTDMDASRDKEGYVISDGKCQFKLK